jgi:hypothetical protein
VITLDPLVVPAGEKGIWDAMRPSRIPSPSEPPHVASEPAVEPEVNGAADSSSDHELAHRFRDYDYSNFYSGIGTDPFDMLEPFDEWWQWARPAGYYQFGLPMHTAPRTRIDIEETKGHTQLSGLVNLASYNYLGLRTVPR